MNDTLYGSVLISSEVLETAAVPVLALALERIAHQFYEAGLPPSPTGMLQVRVTVSPYVRDLSDEEAQ
jgi:hypothetical protein